MKTTILKLTLLLSGLGLLVVGGTTIGASEAAFVGSGKASPAPTPPKRTRRNSNVNSAANIAWNAAWTEANMAANTDVIALSDYLHGGFEPQELPTCIDQPKGTDEAHLYFLNAQDILDAAGTALIEDGNRGKWKKLRRESVRCLTKALSLDSSNRTYLLKRAEVNDDDPLLVIKDVSKVIESSPDEADLFIQRAEASVAAKQLKAALADYAKAISLEPMNPSHYVARSLFVNIYLNDAEQALSDLNRAVVISPSNTVARSRRLDIFLAKKDYPNALKDASILIENHPSNSFYNLSRSEIYEAAGRLDDALTDLNAAIKKSPSSYLLFRERAKFYRRTGKVVLAVRDERIAKRLETQSMKKLDRLQ